MGDGGVGLGGENKEREGRANKAGEADGGPGRLDAECTV